MAEEQSSSRKTGGRRRPIDGRAVAGGCLFLVFMVPAAAAGLFIAFALGWGMASSKGLSDEASIPFGCASGALGAFILWKWAWFYWKSPVNFERWKRSGEPEAWVRKRFERVRSEHGVSTRYFIGKHLDDDRDWKWNDDQWIELWRALRKSQYWPISKSAVAYHLRMLHDELRKEFLWRISVDHIEIEPGRGPAGDGWGA